MLILDATVMNVALPRIQAGLHFSTAGLSWVIDAYTLAFGGLLLLGGRVGDLVGRRRLFVVGIAVFTLASLVGGLSTSATMLLAARVLQGVGGAMAGPSTIALIVTSFPEPRERIRALALFSGMSSAGLAIGLVLGGVLTDALSWRWVLFINVPFGVAAALLALRYVRESERHPAALDLPGAFTGTVGVAGLVYAFIRAAGSGWGDPAALVSLVGGVLVLGVFVLVELRAEQPLLPLRLLADRNRAAAYLNFFLGPMAMLGMFFFLTQFMQEVYGLDPLVTGLAFMPMPVLLFTVTRLMSRLLARFGPRSIAVTGSALMIAGLVWLTQLTETTSYAAGVLGPLMLFGLGAGLGFAPLNVIIMSSVPPRDAGAAGGVLQTAQQIGGALGLAVLVTVFGVAARHATHPGVSAGHVLTSGMTAAFVASTVFACCSLLVALTFRRQSDDLRRG
jgi:EmrB/QacA subfamily drug resistance transporter